MSSGGVDTEKTICSTRYGEDSKQNNSNHRSGEEAMSEVERGRGGGVAAEKGGGGPRKSDCGGGGLYSASVAGEREGGSTRLTCAAPRLCNVHVRFCASLHRSPLSPKGPVRCWASTAAQHRSPCIFILSWESFFFSRTQPKHLSSRCPQERMIAFGTAGDLENCIQTHVSYTGASPAQLMLDQVEGRRHQREGRGGNGGGGRGVHGHRKPLRHALQ